jgi:AraC-like DNA-binding protein
MKNQKDNVCTFIPTHHSYGDLQILHFVYETKPLVFDGWKTISHYKLNFCIDGEGILHTPTGEYPLKKGTVFFCLPSVPYGIETVKDLKFTYIGYMGEKAQAFNHKFNISEGNCVFNEFSHLLDIWLKAIVFPPELTEVYAEGLFHCTFAEIASLTVQSESVKNDLQAASLVKKHVDENFADSNLSLDTLCKALSYNAKYLSNVFSKKFGINFKKYLSDIRINNACNLIKKGFTSIKDVAFLCGFNDPLYFSKVFKQKLGITPTEFILETIKQIENKH